MRKRCNSNDANSMFEQAEGELRAKLMGGGGAWPDNKSTRRAHVSTPGTTGVEGAGGSGCDTHGRRQGLAGQRVNAQSTHQRPGAAGVEGAGGTGGHGRASRHDTKPPISNPAPLVWRAPEGPEGTGGLRGAAPNNMRPPSLAGGRDLRRPEHPCGHKQHQRRHKPLTHAA